MKQKILLIVLLLIVSLIGLDTIIVFMQEHQYYYSMLSTGSNRIILIGAIISAMIPVGYLVWTREITGSKEISLKYTLITVYIGLLLFSFIHLMTKDTLIGSGFLLFLFNTTFIFALGRYFMISLVGVGDLVCDQIKLFKEKNMSHLLLSFGIGLGAVMLLIHILINLGILYSLFSWIIFIGIGVITYYRRSSLRGYTQIINTIATQFQSQARSESIIGVVSVILLVLSIAYYYYGFQMSFIPYSTAWDANHAYMYHPKVIAEYGGMVEGVIASVYLWISYITLRFSLMQPIKSRFRLSPDNIAVSMNFLSGIFVLIFGLGTMYEFLEYIKIHGSKANKKINEIGNNLYTVLFQTGWIGLLLWLTSGMGAFLVFIDNKTDLGVLALTLLALISGFIYINQSDSHASAKTIDNTTRYYGIIAGLMFCLAVMAKPTAFIDVAVFGLLLASLRISRITAVGGGLLLIGILAKLQILNMRDFMSAERGRPFILIGGALVIIHPISHVIKGKTKNLNLIAIRGVSFFGFLLLLKGPFLLAQQIKTGDFSPSNFGKGLLMGQVSPSIQYQTPLKLEPKQLANKPTILLASSNIYDRLLAQVSSDQGIQITTEPVTAISTTSESTTGDVTVKTETTSSVSPQSCTLDRQQVSGGKDGTLYDGLRIGFWSNTNEDIGRYVGYGQKEFKSPRWNIFLPDGLCMGPISSAVTLCQYRDAINSFDADQLSKALTQMAPSSSGYILLNKILSAPETKQALQEGTGNLLLKLDDEIQSLNAYYQDTVIRTQGDSVYVPYRYIVPFNIVFNRSLQNLSSYYTDIGFIRLFFFLFVIVGFFYSLRSQNSLLGSLSIVTVFGRAMRRLIGGGILRYGIGLIIWTILTVIVLIQDIDEHNSQKLHNQLFLGVLIIMGFWISLQFLFNFIRISSQGSVGPFVWYKQSNGTVPFITSQLQYTQVNKVPYRAKDVFDLQFPHYNKFIEHTKTRKDEDGVLIAGTYIQYFLDNQRNLKGDGMTNRLREMGSDGNICKTYLRIKDSKLKYLVIDPNIVSVVMGGGNDSLYDRFFAKINPVDGSIEDDGTMSLLAKLRDQGYITLFNSNNLGSKYAFILDDAELGKDFNISSKQELIKLRAKLAIARFMPEREQLITYIMKKFDERMVNGQAVGDIADVFGKIVDENKVNAAVLTYLNQQGRASEELTNMIKKLTQDERFVVLQYISLTNMRNNQATAQQYQQAVNQNIIGQSIGGASQLMVFEIK